MNLDPSPRFLRRRRPIGDGITVNADTLLTYPIPCLFSNRTSLDQVSTGIPQRAPGGAVALELVGALKRVVRSDAQSQGT